MVLGEYNTKTEVDCIKYDEDYQECTDRPKEIPIKSVVVHPKWNDPQWANDIAVIKLLTPVDYSGNYYRKTIYSLKIHFSQTL